MNWEKHESSLLKVFSDAGSTPAASKSFIINYLQDNGHFRTPVLSALIACRRCRSLRDCPHPHMFRDTFGVEMLLAGVPIDQVSLLL
jgi:hypothetical protein